MLIDEVDRGAATSISVEVEEDVVFMSPHANVAVLRHPTFRASPGVFVGSFYSSHAFTVAL